MSCDQSVCLWLVKCFACNTPPPPSLSLYKGYYIVMHRQHPFIPTPRPIIQAAFSETTMHTVNTDVETFVNLVHCVRVQVLILND